HPHLHRAYMSLAPWVSLAPVVVAASFAAGSNVIAARVVSRTSPFVHCADGGANVFAGAEVEPSIATDAAGKRIVIVYQQDRFADAASRGIVASYSADRGRTWRRSVLPVGFCAEQHDTEPFRVSDPWV